jgi:signal transduction histidine kinase
MTFLPSLRSRLLLGSVLWTLGLLPVAHVVSIAILLWHPGVFGSSRVVLGQAGDGQEPTTRALLHYGAILVTALAFMVAGLAFVRLGLSPVNRLRMRLSSVHGGRDRRVEGTYPTEVQPLVDDLNALLEHRERRVRDALAKAGDLAHGLKTPLSVLAHEAETADAAGHPELAMRIRQQVERMRRQIEYHLAHARAEASGAAPGARCPVAESAEALARTLQRLHAGRGVIIDVRVAREHAVRGQREDLDEMLGNLLDNACKWAKSRIAVQSTASGGVMVITVDDDGAGLAASMRDAVLQRGVRADEAAPGSGLGLAIVRDLAELYGGSITLSDSPMGGLRARLALPAS